MYILEIRCRGSTADELSKLAYVDDYIIISLLFLCISLNLLQNAMGKYTIFKTVLLYLLRSAVVGRLYKHHSKHTSNSGFDRSFMPCSCYILFAAEQRVGYQISWVDLQREVNCP